MYSLKPLVRTSLTTFLTALMMSVPLLQAADVPTAEQLAQGKKLAFERGKGNCLACHMMDSGELPGNIGPPLIAMQARFPEREVLREQIHDARIKNPHTIMPPFGSHGILTAEEIDLITDYIHSL